MTDGGVTLCTPRTLSTMFTMFTMSFFPLCTTISLVHGSGLARQHIAATLAVYEHLCIWYPAAAPPRRFFSECQCQLPLR